MKTLTLAAVAVVALLGFLSGCDESQTMMDQVTREVTPAPEEKVTVETTPPAPEVTIGTTLPARRGEVTLAETACETDYCLVGISYTNDANPDGSGQLTLYFDIPEALGPGPHRVVVRYRSEFLQTDIPIENKQSVRRIDPTGNVHSTHIWNDYTEATLFLDADDKIVFKYRFASGSDSVRIVIGDAISGDAPGAVAIGDPPIDPDWDGEGQYYERSFELHSGAPPVEEPPRVLRGEELVRATVCQNFYSPRQWEGVRPACFVGISYTHEWNPDNTGKLTIYFDIPEALGPGPHRVLVRYETEFMETDIPFENKQFFEGKKEDRTFHQFVSSPYTESILFLDSDDKIVFNYRIPYHWDSANIVIGDAISDYTPVAVPVGDPNNQEIRWASDADYPHWEGEFKLYHELRFRFYGGIHLDIHGE